MADATERVDFYDRVSERLGRISDTLERCTHMTEAIARHIAEHGAKPAPR